ncbi:apolipoprotein N-acyltransferase [Maritimibacter alexandrii]|uniref:apolipoprotein N-acyltransferase n=1 Tax=Maritimibacter alexandrii TaxID=2570355 RepID=UPI001F2541F4|nr:apolipoprotein N-acyltransferase [Maritimibacter alexandrii]
MREAMQRLAAAKWKGLFAALFFGGMAAVGHEPFGLYTVSIVAFAMGLGLVLDAPSWKRAGVLGWMVGTGFFAVQWSWLVNPFLVDIKAHGWMAPFAVILLAGGMALYWGVASALAALVRPALRWVALPIALGLAEYVRAWAFTGFSWGGPGLIWIDTPVAQIAAWIGAYGLGWVTLFFAALIYVAIYSGWLRVGVVAAGVALAGFGFLADQRPLPPTTENVLRLVQPNAAQHLKWEPDWVMTFFERATALSSAPADGREPDLVVWPETSIPALQGQAPLLEERAFRSAAPAPLVAGIQRREGSTYRNSIVYYDAPGEPAWIYDKHHLVPFGEFVPFGNQLAKIGIRGLAQQSGYGFEEGDGPVIHQLPGTLGKALPLICYEAIFPRDIRGAKGRADMILQLTNDAWFGTFSGPQQHLVHARFRAIEFGLPLARAANTGISAMIDAKGNVTAALPLNEAGFLDADLPAPLPPTVYARIGDLPFIVALSALFAGLLAFARRKSVDPVAAPL